MTIEGTYTFVIEKESSGWYIVTGNTPGHTGRLITQGRNENEVFDMIADAYKCIMDVEVPWHQKVLWKLFKY